MPRTLCVDLMSSAPAWALTPDAERAIRDFAPEGWRVDVVRAPTVSDGDGGRPPSDEAMRLVRDAEVYFGFGLARPLFLGARALRWVHSGAAGVHAVPIAEHVVAGVLHFLRGLDVALARQREGRWDKAPFLEGGARVRE